MKYRYRVLLFALLCSFLVIGEAQTGTPVTETFRISLGSESFPKEQKIVGIEVTVEDGCLSAMLSLPIGWSFKINNESGWTSSASGFAAQGASALVKDDVEKLFAIERVGGEKMMPRVQVIIHSTMDFEHSEKHILKNVKLVRL